MRLKLPASAARQLYGQYFFSGATVALGVFLVWLGAEYTLDALAPAAILGALCTALCDTPAPSGHKLVELALGVVCSALAALITALFAPYALALTASLALIAFFAAMLTAYGRRAMPLSFATLLAALVTLEHPFTSIQAALIHTACFVAGGVSYLIYGVLAGRLTDRFTRRQVLGECLLEFGAYLRAKAAFYDVSTDLDQCYAQLVAQQSVMSEKFQIARDILFRGVRGARRRRLAGAMVAFIDLYERVLTMHTDYGVLRAHYGERNLLAPLAGFCLDRAKELENLGLAVIQYGVELAADQVASNEPEPADFLPAAGHAGEPLDARMALASAYAKMRRTAAAMAHLRACLSATGAARVPVTAHNLEAFVSRGTYRPSLLLSQIRPSSSTFRYAVRLTAAVICGHLLAPLLPFSDRGNWILLSTVVIMRANFSQTRARRSDRVIGNLAGCVIAALLLHLDPGRTVLLSTFFFALAITHAFATQNYRIASTSGCILSFMLLHEFSPGQGHLVEARMLDTFAGAAIATLFSYVLPWWESRSIVPLLADLDTANREFARVALDAAAADHDYRIARKRFQDAIALVTGSYRRMLAEPESRRRAEKTLPRLLAANYELGAQLASIHAARSDLAESIPAAEFARLLEVARAGLDRALSGAAPAGDEAAERGICRSAATANEPGPFAAERLLARRLRLLVRGAGNTAKLQKAVREEVLR
ncbi:MAG: FUSC family protein [Rhodocyclaceae bacterium]|nr:FUSC family protein [Rhodocyclaceae bacterium]